MKNTILILFAFLLISCGKEDFEEEVTLRVNHYKQTAVGLQTVLVFLVQEEEQIGTDTWQYLYDEIEGFDYQFGHVYDIQVTKKSISNPPQDASSVRYLFKHVISETPAPEGSTFEITLKGATLSHLPNVVTGNFNTGYSLLNEVDINCANLCDEFSADLAEATELKGRFVHQTPETIRLIELITP